MSRIPLSTTSRALTVLLLILTLVVTASAEWKEKVLYSFQGLPNDGYFPWGNLTFDSGRVARTIALV
jgi:hypothetical protein